MDNAQRAELIKLSNYFDENNWPFVKCPLCKMGQLTAGKSISVESAQSLAEHSHPAWDPNWIEGIFYTPLTCSNCKSQVFAQGVMTVDIVEIEDAEPTGLGYGTCFKVKYFSRPLDIMTFPRDCPDVIKKRIAEVSEVLWINPDAATNRLRVTIDDLLTSLKIPRNVKNNKSKWQLLTTHARVLLLKKKYPEAALLLEAVKWIGNDGSHDDGLNVSDVLDGIELYNRALNLIYDDSGKILKQKANKINSHKGVKQKRKPKISPMPF